MTKLSKRLPDQASIEFGEQLQKYLSHYGLSEADIAKEIKSNTGSVKQIIKGEKSVVLKTAEQIAGIFGLRYFQFGNPSYPLPKLEHLPQKTQLLIEKRAQTGIPIINRDEDLNLAEYVLRVLSSEELPNEFTSRDIFNLLPPDIQQEIKHPSRISVIFIKSKDIKNKIILVKRNKAPEKRPGRLSNVYRLKNGDQ